jgi:uncharacterized protein (DUF1778 family)
MFFHGFPRFSWHDVLMSDAQISASISAATKERLDRFTEQHGLKKNYVVEQALLYFMEARRELPDEAFIPTRIVVDDETFERIVDAMENPPRPTAGLRELMRDPSR